MNTQSLLDRYFEVAFSAPEGVKRLRELILNLAMRGLLVPQDPTAQPARELLREIEAEKDRLIRAGKIKKANKLPEISPEEIPYELPDSWEWVRLNDLGVWKSGSTPSRTNHSFYTGNIPWVKSGEVKQGRIYKTDETISTEALSKCSLELNPVGSVLIAMYGANIGDIGILEIEATTNQAVCACQTFLKIDNIFLSNLLLSLKQKFIEQGAGAAQPNISRVKIINTIVPLPPLEEQKRIVEKVDRLMEQCDRLEQLHKEREQKRIIVHAAARDRLLNAKGDRELQTAWEFLRDRFGDLYAVKENISELRKVILQLAVMGKLVPQDPNDPPASELLKEIQAEKQRLFKEGKIKNQNLLIRIFLNEVPFCIPQNWIWICLGDVVIDSDSGWSPQCLKEKRVNNNWGVLKVSSISYGKFNSDENKALPLGMEPKPEIEVHCNDFLLSRANTEDLVARSVVVEKTPPNLMMSDKIVRLKFLKQKVNIHFLNLVNLSSESRSYYARNASGTSASMKNISRHTIYGLPVPLPPLSEQHRIVAKVDQLMQLCDQLESKIDQQTQTQTNLLNTLMAQLS